MLVANDDYSSGLIVILELCYVVLSPPFILVGNHIQLLTVIITLCLLMTEPNIMA